MWKSARPALVTLGAGLVGAALAALIGIPAGALIGSTLVVVGLAVAGLPVGLPGMVRDLAFATIGVSLGAGIDARLLSQLGIWGVSLAILVVSLIVTILLGRLILTRGFALDAQTATLASAPGTMSNVIAIAAEGRGDATAVMFLQLMRLLILMIAVPPLAVSLDAAGIAPGAPLAAMGLPVLAGLLVIAVLTGMIGTRLGLPAASLLAGMLISAGGHVTGLVQGVVPAWVIFAAFAITGAAIGSRISRVSRDQFRHFALAGLVVVGVALVTSLVFALLAVVLTDLPFGQIWVAYAPGGVEAMAAIALSLGYDPAYVATHHFARIFALVLILPIMLKI